jgi:hypothetical protein
MSDPEILIVTSCIDPQRVYCLAISDRDERLRQSICSLVGWILYTKVSTIVLCDGGLREYDFQGIADFARAHDKSFEALHVKPDPLTETLGKGYGEGLIMRHALTHSEYAKEGTSFYKITGRSFVANFDEISAREAAHPLVFASKATPLFSFANLEYMVRKSFDNARRHYRRRGVLCFLLKPMALPTHFYKCSVAIYKKLLADESDKVLDSQGYWLEHAFYDRLRFRVRWNAFSIKPTIIGRSGSSGALYDGDYSADVKNIAEGLVQRMR